MGAERYWTTTSLPPEMRTSFEWSAVHIDGAGAGEETDEPPSSPSSHVSAAFA